ncbi:hypothetical protein C1645_814703 [Glomus cerebriforme]|uniref:Uncharacterized protein n=1 Tax=Glomus cerebriforme TaxID=658196 RepID=A0A397TPS7_9GLOM|nr:hypothetical protein C1645_814703 [Glomus cerebriforme]
MSTQDSNKNNPVLLDIIIGAVVIGIGAIIYVGYFLCKKRRKGIDIEGYTGPILEMEEIDSPKKTAADHLEEIQKILKPTKNSSTPNTSSTPSTLPRKKKNSLNIDSPIGINSNNININDSKLQKNPPPPPPPPSPSPLNTQYDDDIRTDPIRMSIVNLLLSDSDTLKTSVNSSKVSSKVSSRELSRRISSRSSSRIKPRTSSHIRLQSQNGTNRSNQKSRFIHSHKKETNDYTNFQPIQSIISTQNIQVVQSITPAETAETEDSTHDTIETDDESDDFANFSDM